MKGVDLMAADNIILIGMPGAGKSTLGVVLAKILGYDFLDCDLMIQKKYGTTLERLIDQHGAEGFIALENAALLEVACEHTIVSTGGSAVYSDEAMRYLSTLGKVVYLEVSLEDLDVRLGGLHERGVVMRDGVGMSLAALYAEREPLYQRYADLTFNVFSESIHDTAIALAQVVSQ